MAKRLVGLGIALTVGAVFAWLSPIPITLADPPDSPSCYILIEKPCVEGAKTQCSEVCGDRFDCSHAKVWVVYDIWALEEVDPSWPGSRESYTSTQSQMCKMVKHCKEGFPCSDPAYTYLCEAAGCYSDEDYLCKFDRYGTLYWIGLPTLTGDYCTDPEE